MIIRRLATLAFLWAFLPLGVPPRAGAAEPGARDLVRRAEERRIAVINQAAPSVVCMFDQGQTGGGSGVIIDEDGYGLTNFHVVAGMMGTREGLGGLIDGKLYDVEVLGIDPGGDVAMFRVQGKDKFAFSKLGDSDAVRIGDPVLAMGNPFLLSGDYAPTVTFGIVSGTHRYQWGQGNQLVYSDCIQTDAPINPGNSGGPLFNMQGEVIGINGRISVNTRGRFNVGFGYSISINQIKRFMPGLRAGLLTEHGTLQATVADRPGRGLVFDEMIRDASAYNAGLRVGDKLLRFDDLPVRSPNHFASLLGTYPAHWPVPIDYEREGKRYSTTAVLEPLSAQLDAKFEVDREINVRQTRRVLLGYQAFACGGNRDESSLHHALINRTLMLERSIPASGKDAGENTAELQQWRLELGDMGSHMRLVRVYADGQQGKRYRCDRNSVVRLSGKGEAAGGETKTLAVPMETQLVLASYAVLFDALYRRQRDWNLDGVTHAGGSVWVDDTGEASGAARRERVLLEMIEWPILEHGKLRLAFRQDTHRLMQATAMDMTTGRRVIIGIQDYTGIAGARVPSLFKVSGAAREYTSRLWTNEGRRE